MKYTFRNRPRAPELDYHAVCSVCGKVTAGAWFVHDGARFRAPRRHAGIGEIVCPGSYKEAVLRKPD